MSKVISKKGQLFNPIGKLISYQKDIATKYLYLYCFIQIRAKVQIVDAARGGKAKKIHSGDEVLEKNVMNQIFHICISIDTNIYKNGIITAESFSGMVDDSLYAAAQLVAEVVEVSERFGAGLYTRRMLANPKTLQYCR